MLIHSLQLTNFKRYADLSIDDLPEEGVIKVGGKNESGKTSIGEAVCFALFGRTFTSEAKHAKRLIRWGEHEASITLVLSNDADEKFKIIRTIKESGLSSVCISRLSDDSILSGSLAGGEKVISDLLGYDYDTFVDSFCMVQKELTTPDANSNSIKQMAGIGDFGGIVEDLTLERKEEEVALDALKPNYDEETEKLDAIELDESWLPELIDAKESLYSNKKDKIRLVEQLDDVNSAYPDCRSRQQTATKSQNFFEWLSVFLLPLMIGAWFVWGGFQFFPDVVAELLPNDAASSHVDSFITWVQRWVFPSSMALVLVYSISLFFKWKEESIINMLKLEGEEYSTILHQGHQQVTSEVSSIVPTRVGDLINSRPSVSTESDMLDLPPVEKFGHLPKLVELTAGFFATPAEVSDSISSLQLMLHAQGKEIDQQLELLQDDIDLEKGRSDKAGKLRAGLHKITQAIEDHQTNINIRDCSIEMLKRSACNSIGDFNRLFTAFTEKTLPHFTNNRYSKIKIGDDLSVDVYSSKKQSYITFDEVSSGTQRQIMLAIRMGMSEQLAINTGNKHQFIFLDEPFAFFDHQRTIATLDALPKVSDIISQVWVTSQEFPEELTLVSK